MRARHLALPGGTVFIREWPAPAPGAPRLHFAHATGMHGGIYARLLEALAAHFHVFASDARGHGGTTLPADPAGLTSWRPFADDLADVLAATAPGPWWLAGHSMGAAVSLELAVRRPGLAAGVAMLEPAFIPFAAAPAWRFGGPNPMAGQAARRRAVFASRDEARAAWHGRGVFARWSDADLDAYVADGVRDRPDGQVELACAPAWEAATFAAVTASLEAAFAAWRGPLLVARGVVGSTVQPGDLDAIAELAPQARVMVLADTSHFLPLEQPAELAAAMVALDSNQSTGETTVLRRSAS